MVNKLTLLIVAVILTETVTEIIVKSELFFPFRAKIFELGKTNRFFKWVHSLIDCGYCFSVWAGTFLSILLFNEFHVFNKAIDWFLFGLVVHRLSNLFHNVMDNIHNS